MSAPREKVTDVPDDDLPATGADTLRRGLRVLARGMRDEPGMFSLAVAGSAVYGIGTAASGWWLGHLTQTVLAPAFAAHHITRQQLLYVVGTLAGIALATSIGVVGRRAAGGATMYRLQARYRRRGHAPVPAAAAVLAPPAPRRASCCPTPTPTSRPTWQVFAPLPMALGVLVMLVVAAVAMVARRPGARRWSGCCVVPAGLRRQRRVPAPDVARA